MLCALALMSCSAQSGTEVSKVKPVAPAAVAVSMGAGGAEVSWSAVPGVTSYTVFWGTDRGDYRKLANTTETSLIVSELKKGEMYAFAVTCWNDRGESNYSDEQLLVYDDEPTRAREHLAKANALSAKGMYEEAHIYYSAVIRLDPKNAEAYTERARLYARSARPELAAADNAAAERIYKLRPMSALDPREKSVTR
jgi:hypothetical protein